MPVNNAFLDYLDNYDSDNQTQQKTSIPVQSKPVQDTQKVPIVQKQQYQPVQRPFVQKPVQQQTFARTMKPRTKIKVSIPQKPSHSQQHAIQQHDEENILNSFNELELQTKKQAAQNYQRNLQVQQRQKSEEEAQKIAERVHQIEQQKKYQQKQQIKQQAEQAKQEEIKKQFQQAVQTQVQQPVSVKEVVPQPPQPQFPHAPKTEEISDEEVSPIDLAQAAETCFLEEWFDIYQKGQKSKKRNEAARKIKAGRFRINRNHEVELLPDVVTAGLTANEILERQWI